MLIRQRQACSAPARCPASILPASTIPRGDLGADDESVPSSFLDVQTLKAGIPGL